MKVFVVEDNEDTRLLLAEMVEFHGHEVRTARTLQAALCDPYCFNCDVLLSDIGPPDGTGWDLLRAIRLAGSLPYAIAMSGFGTLADIAASSAAGYRHHLVKPIQLDTLERLFDEARQEIKGPR